VAERAVAVTGDRAITLNGQSQSDNGHYHLSWLSFTLTFRAAEPHKEDHFGCGTGAPHSRPCAQRRPRPRSSWRHIELKLSMRCSMRSPTPARTHAPPRRVGEPDGRLLLCIDQTNVPMSWEAPVRFRVSVVVAALLLTGCNANQEVNLSSRTAPGVAAGPTFPTTISMIPPNTGRQAASTPVTLVRVAVEAARPARWPKPSKEDRFPRAPRLDPLRSALAKLDPTTGAPRFPGTQPMAAAAAREAMRPRRQPDEPP
jgi:hypothetical protein